METLSPFNTNPRPPPQPDSHHLPLSPWFPRGPCISGITQELSFCDGLILRSTVSSRFTHVVAGDRLNTIPLSEWALVRGLARLRALGSFLPPGGCEHGCADIPGSAFRCPVVPGLCARRGGIAGSRGGCSFNLPRSGPAVYMHPPLPTPHGAQGLRFLRVLACTGCISRSLDGRHPHA